jgi:hypothetical protein
MGKHRLRYCNTLLVQPYQRTSPSLSTLQQVDEIKDVIGKFAEYRPEIQRNFQMPHDCFSRNILYFLLHESERGPTFPSSSRNPPRNFPKSE